MSRKVIIVGGGLAGLSASVFAIQKGFKPILFERTPNLGGRARSFFASDVDAEIDNGQHVLSNAYHHTRHFLKIIGSENKVHFQKKLQVDFRSPDGISFLFKSVPLPSPFHFAFPLLTNRRFTVRDKLALLRFFRGLKILSSEKLRLMTVREWLRVSNQTPSLIHGLWEPLVLATLNTDLQTASAYLMKTVLEKAFLSDYQNCGLGLPADFLTRIFAQPGKAFIEKHGGKIFLGESIKTLTISEGNIFAVETSRKRKFLVDHLIIAIPPIDFMKLLTNNKTKLTRILQDVQSFSFSPIINMHFWTSAPLQLRAPTALINSSFHWIFPRADSEFSKNFFGYTGVISDARSLVNLSPPELVHLLQKDLNRFFRLNRIAKKQQNIQIIKYKVIKEKRATVRQDPFFIQHRPSITTPIKNLFIIGDWVNTGLPATIESAITSGKQVIEKICKNGN